MKFDGSDPPRVDEGEASELGELVRASRARRMSSHASARIAQRLAMAGAFAGAASSASSKPGLFGRLGSAKTGALALVGLGAAVFAWQTQISEPALPPASPAATQAVTVAASPSPSPSPSPTVETPSISVDALPSSDAPALVASARARTAAPYPSSSSRTPGAEFAFIERARDALASDPSRALVIVEEHARTFPTGELVQEREVMAVEALARLDRKAEAKSRANALLARFPRTPYVARLERALGEPLSSALPSRTAR